MVHISYAQRHASLDYSHITKSYSDWIHYFSPQMAWRYRIGKNLQELRFLYCADSVGSKGVRYVTMIG